MWPLYRRPSRLRVPSGKMPNSSPRRSTSSATSRATSAFSPPLRSIGIMPIVGNRCLVFHEFMYSALPTKLMRRGTDSIRNAESRKVMWLGQRMAGPSLGQAVEPGDIELPQPTGERTRHRASAVLRWAGTRREITLVRLAGHCRTG